MKIAKYRLFLYVFLLMSGCSEQEPTKPPNSTKSAESNTHVKIPEPTKHPVEAWVLTDKQTYQRDEIFGLRLLIKNCANHVVRLPVPVICVNGSGWGELQLDLFINGRKFSAQCHTSDIIEIHSGDEVSWRIQNRRLEIPIGKTPWQTQGHFTVYAVWHRKDFAAQKDNDFLGPLVSHAAEFNTIIQGLE